MYSDGFNHDHRCENCGCRYGDHKGEGDNCPPVGSYGNPIPLFLAPNLTDAEMDATIRRYWTLKTWQPRR